MTILWVFWAVTLLVSGVIIGGFPALHNILGYSNPYVGGNSESNIDRGIVPLFILKTGIGSLVGGLIASEALSINEQYLTIIAGIFIGGGLAGLHAATVWLLASTSRFNCGLVGSGIGMFLGGIAGVIAAFTGAGILDNDTFGLILFFLSLVGGLILGVVLGSRYGESSAGSLAVEISSAMLLCGIAGGLFGLFEDGMGAAIGCALFGLFLGKILGASILIVLLIANFLGLITCGIFTPLLIRQRFATIICSSCFRYTQPFKSQYETGIRYCEHCHSKVEQTSEPGKVIFIFGQFSEFQLQQLQSGSKRIFLFLNPTFGEKRAQGLFFHSSTVDLDQKECPIDVSEVYIAPKTCNPRLLERFITYIINYPPEHGIRNIKLFYSEELDDLGKYLKNALRNNFEGIGRMEL